MASGAYFFIPVFFFEMLYEVAGLAVHDVQSLPSVSVVMGRYALASWSVCASMPSLASR